MNRRNLRVLLLEDNLSDAELIKHLLSKCRDNLEFAFVQTEDRLRDELKNIWDAILCDYRLPFLPWPAALHICQKIVPDTPFIVVSGMAKDKGLQIIREGADDYVDKNDMQDLCLTVEREIIHHQAIKQLKQANRDLLELLD